MRTLFHKPEIQRIDFLDNRYYTNDGVTYYPSVTEILSIYPKGFGFEQWLKDVGNNASQIADRAAAVGSKIHDATEHLDNGNEIKWDGEIFSLEEWQMLLRYNDFKEKCQPIMVANEMNFCSESLKFGGTLDRVFLIAGKRWLIDIKTSNYIHKSYELQLAAYANLWNEANPEQPIEQTGILWLKSGILKNKIDTEKDVYQGITDAGAWQIKTFKRHYDDAFKIFKHTQAIWQEENPNYKPANKTFPDRIKL